MKIEDMHDEMKPVRHMRRFVIEFGIGADLHGGDVTKAARKAVQDAMSHCCLCGIDEVLHLKNFNDVHVKMKVGCPYPERVKQEELAHLIPFGETAIEVVNGGLTTQGMHVASLGGGDQIVVAVVSLTVCVEQ